MFRPILKRLVQVVISFVFFAGIINSSAETVRVCIWEGSYKPSLESFKGKYRGNLSLVRWNKRYLVINEMEIEEYLFGVIGKEMDKSWPFEALKAQAICSRTLIYYYKEIAAKKKMPYDVSDTIYHQVYGGVSSEDENIVRAVEETSDMVLAGHNKEKGYNIVPAFFHACCGGHTSFASDVWQGEYSLLVGVEDPYCAGTPFYNWNRSFTKDELKLLTGVDVVSLKISGFNRSGRASKLEFTGKSGKKTIGAENFRLMTINKSTTFKSTKTLPSTMFTVVNNGNNITFCGRGYGHGVGMCQWGARKMAEEGKTYVEIIQHYFPELKIVVMNIDKGQSLNVPLREKP